MATATPAAAAYVQNLLERVISGRPAAEHCAHIFVQGLVQKALAAKDKGAAREVAALCAREAVKGFVEKAQLAMKSGSDQQEGHEREVAAACARVAVARYVEKASANAKTNRVQGSERETAAGCARIAVAGWISNAANAAKKEGQEGKVAAACARVAVARFVEKAKQTVRLQGQTEKASDRVPEIVKRHESKAFEEALAQGNEREVAALCAQYAVKQYVAKACDAVRQQGPQTSVRSTVEKVHSSVVKAANHLASATQTTRDNLEGMISECDEVVKSSLAEEQSPTGTRSPMKPRGVAPKKKRPAPKLKENGAVHIPLAELEAWIPPPPPESFSNEVRAPALKHKEQKHKPRSPQDVEEERKRDVEFLQQRHQENLQRFRQAQQEERSQRQQSFVRDVSYLSSFPPQGSGRRLRAGAEPQPPTKGAKGGRGSTARASSSRRGHYVKQNHELSACSDMASCSKDTSNSILALPENLLATMAQMEAEAPRSVVDDPVLRAYLAVYKSTVCKRGEDDISLRGAATEEPAEGMPTRGPRDGDKRRAKSAASRVQSRESKSWLQPGLMSWQDRGKAWFWPRKGAVPPMETAVLALLNGQPPPITATAQAAAAARQQFALPMLQKVQQVCSWAPRPEARTA